MPCSWQIDPELCTASCYVHELSQKKKKYLYINITTFSELRCFEFFVLTPQKNGLWTDMDSDWEGGMRNADTGDILYDDATHSNTEILGFNWFHYLSHLYSALSASHTAFTWAFWYLPSITLSFIILYSVSAHSWLHAVTLQRRSDPAHLKYSRLLPRRGKPSLSWPGRDKQHTGWSFFTPLWYTCSVSLRRKSRLFVLLRPLSFRTGERDH